MKAAIKQLFARPLRYAVRLVVQRPWLKQRVRSMVMRMPRVHGLLLRLMFQASAAGRQQVRADRHSLSPNAQRNYRALKQAIRTHRS